jgi:hypothetical protein
VAGVIAGHGHGASDSAGIVGVAPKARILSVRVTLEFNDPLNSDPAVARRLPGAIAAGIRYAADHGARVVDLPLDPGTLGLTGHGDPAAAGGSAAEQAAVAYALSKGVVLVAPAGDDGQGPGIVNYPAAYPGVLAVGAVGRDGRLGSFSSRHGYVSLTAPGVGLVAAAPPDGYGQISTTGTASGMVAGVAALLLARFPHLTVAQVSQALAESTAAAAGGVTQTAGGARPASAAAGGLTQTAGASLPPLPARSADGAGYGTVNAARALSVAALIVTSRKPATGPARPSRRSHGSQGFQHAVPAAPAGKAPAGTLAGSLVRYIVAGLVGLIAVIAVLLLLMRSRRARVRAPQTARAHARGLHEHRRPAAPAGATGPRPAPRDVPTAAAQGAASGGWQGGGLGEIVPGGSFRPAIAPVPRGTARSGRGAGGGAGGSAGPPWEPAPAPERMSGPLPVVSRSAYPQTSGPGIRVPRDMAPPPAAPELPVRSAAAEFPLPVPEFPTRPDLPAATGLPTQQSLDFAAAPVPADYAAPPAPAVFDFGVPGLPDLTVHHEDPGPAAGKAAASGPAGGASFIWELSATDVFPIASDPATPPPAPGAVPPRDAPGASGD